MTSDRIEPRLLREIQRIEAAGEWDCKIPVIIEHFSKMDKARKEEPRIEYGALEQRVRAEQQSIRERLSKLGVTGDIEQMTLSNSLVTRLTPGQIKEIARHEDVKLIVWNREEEVTA